jgi:asparagine synthase (glutamine-hydrolysing)
MSAIFGLIHLQRQSININDLERMSASLAALGPDANGIWADGHVGIGQRLMRFTHEDSFDNQPLLSADRQMVLVCDARIDNRQELVADLGVNTSEARQLADSAFILRAYEKWGEECVLHLIGDYSFALWDKREQHLILARSAVGGRPLYYHSNDRLFAFSTLPKGLFTQPSIPRELNLERIADYLVQAPIEPCASFYCEIQRLHSGHLLKVGRHGLNLRKFWQPDLQREIRYSCDDDYVDAFNALFERVVSDHLRSTAAVGVMMSGGLDSTSVAAVAATQLRKHGKRLATFTEVPRAGFDGVIVKGRYADEAPFVQTMSRQFDNIDLNFIHTDNRMYLDDLDRFFASANIPFRNATNRVWYEAIFQAASEQGVRVLLTGAQGNLTMSRSGRGLLPLLLRKGKWLRALHEARASGNGTLLKTLLGQGVMPLLPTSLFAAIRQMRGRDRLAAGEPLWRAYSAINPEFARAQRVDERAREKRCDFHFRGDPDMRLTYGKMLPGLTMTANDITHAYRGLFGTDVRDPTADLRIVEFCLALPEEQYLKDGVSRRLVRRAMAHKLPVEILENRHRGLQAADWFERMLASREKLLFELAEWGKSNLLSGILDLKRMIGLLEQMPHAQGDPSKIMTEYRQLLEFGLMMGRFIRWFEHGESGRA